MNFPKQKQETGQIGLGTRHPMEAPATQERGKPAHPFLPQGGKNILLIQ
jgi:hypothetical protein